MDTRNKSKPVIGIGLIVGILVLALLLGLSGEMKSAKAMQLQAGAPPVVLPDIYKYVLNTTLTVSASGVLSNDTDPENETIQATPVINGTTARGGQYTLNANGGFTYTPPLDYTGTDSFNYTAVDSLTPVQTSLATKVTLVTNFPPRALNDVFYYTVGAPTNSYTTPGVLFNDSDPENNSISVVVSSLGYTEGLTLQKGTYKIWPDGHFTYTPPTPNDPVLPTEQYFFSADFFYYKITDGTSNSELVRVKLLPNSTTNMAPPNGIGAGTCNSADCGIAYGCSSDKNQILSIDIADVKDLCTPPICNPVTNVCIPDLGLYDFDVVIAPNAQDLYSMGVWFEYENVGTAAITDMGAFNGQNCYKSYYYPIKSKDVQPSVFELTNGYGPFRNSDNDICGDAKKSDLAEVHRIIKDVPIVCTEQMMKGQISALVAWKQQASNCTNPYQVTKYTCQGTTSMCWNALVPFEVSNKPVDLELQKESPDKEDGFIPTVGEEFNYKITIKNIPHLTDTDNNPATQLENVCYRSSGYVIEDLLPDYLKAVGVVSVTAFGYGTTPVTISPTPLLECVDLNGLPVPCGYGSITQIKIQRSLPYLGLIGDPLKEPSIMTPIPYTTCNAQYHEVILRVKYYDVANGYGYPNYKPPRTIYNYACVNGFQDDPWGGARQSTDQDGNIVVLPAYDNNCNDDVITTAVDLTYFQATPQEGSILLEWETATETDNLGFNLYRATNEAGDDKVQLNNGLIPSNSPGGTQGSSYSFVDAQNLDPAVTYYYWLEDVDFYGVATLHGPTMAKVITTEPLWIFKIFLPFMDKR